jgi:hypothetical protein
VSRNANSSILAQRLDLGGDRDFGGGDDTVTDLARIAGAGPGGYETILFADVFKNGANDFTIVGTYRLADAGASPVVIEGAFASSFTALLGGALFVGGEVSNPDGILRPGSPNTSWLFTGDADRTPNMIQGVFGGADGVDGTLAVADLRSAFDRGNLLEFHIAGDFQDLDSYFDAPTQSSSVSDLSLMVKVPAPGAVALGMVGLALLGALKRFCSRVG